MVGYEVYTQSFPIQRSTQHWAIWENGEKVHNDPSIEDNKYLHCIEHNYKKIEFINWNKIKHKFYLVFILFCCLPFFMKFEITNRLQDLQFFFADIYNFTKVCLCKWYNNITYDMQKGNWSQIGLQREINMA